MSRGPDDDPWRIVATALDGAAAAGCPVRFWLRDDDAIAATPALQHLAALVAKAAAPVLLAVIPAGCTADLPRFLATQPLLTPCQHGYAHRNHAARGERACELGGMRDDEVVLAELAEGRQIMQRLFGPTVSPVLVPPWNRIRPSLVSQLPRLGFSALSTFAGAAIDPAPGVSRLDSDLDIIDWRNGRRGRDARDLADRLALLVAAARQSGAPIGILTHHLVHDATAWTCLAALLDLIRTHPGAAFTSMGVESPAPQS